MTLFTTPVIYLYFDRAAIWFRERFGAPPPREQPAL
jgi:hypothetical protein